MGGTEEPFPVGHGGYSVISSSPTQDLDVGRVSTRHDRDHQRRYWTNHDDPCDETYDAQPNPWGLRLPKGGAREVLTGMFT